MPALDLVVKGIVQGVGFRPFVYQLASSLTLSGTVKNSSTGVYIHLEGTHQNMTSFLNELKANPPPLSKIDELLILPSKVTGYHAFTILSSLFEPETLTLLSPDIAMCPDCLNDINNAVESNRHHYAFTNCTNCGPRFSIIKQLPYDRPYTTMQSFKMCASCQAEYENPLNRRFHAEPTCCHICGPALCLLDSTGIPLPDSNPITKARSLIKAGAIIAVKGLGGFHLICDATSYKAIKTLRARKHRPTKPLALMMKDLGTVLQYCCLNAKEEEILLGHKKPILLLKKKNECLPYNISFDNHCLGIMLPYTPLHYLLFDETLTVLVATSANHSGLPMLFKNTEALETLNNIADYFLVHDRDIYIPVDDSVVKVVLGEERVIRPARGYAPLSLPLNSSDVLALGSELKNTFCVSKQNHCFMSQYIGDMQTVETQECFIHNVNHFKSIYNIRPKLIAFDYHPNFSYKDSLDRYPGEKMGVFHHHAHIASCLSENGVDETVIGIAFDGVGYGFDGTLWGSEFLICNTREFKRLGHLRYFKMPGGDMATVWPWRMAISFLYEAFGDTLEDILPYCLTNKHIKPVWAMLRKDIACPLCCSMGRFFDAVAALLGFDDQVSYEAEACIYLENLALSSVDTNCAYNYTLQEIDGIWIIDYISIIQGIIHDLQMGTAHTFISRKFHNTLCLSTLHLCLELKKGYDLSKVALSGGVFQNDLLFTQLYALLIKNGFEVFTHKLVPCNDSGLSLGQLVIASEMIRK